MRRRAVVALAAMLAACRAGADTPLGTAERFLDEHYVRINLDAAAQYTTGLAAHKVAQERELTKGQVIDESTRMPRIHYKLVETKARGDEEVSFVFEASVRVDDAGTFTRKLLVSTRRDSGVWKVSNYQEYD